MEAHWLVDIRNCCPVEIRSCAKHVILATICWADCTGTLKVIDFGLSKRFVDDDGSVVPQREGKAGFRGSTAYASLYAHEEQELGMPTLPLFQVHNDSSQAMARARAGHHLFSNLP